MEKAYDFKELGLMMKGKGLDLAEESLALVFEGVMDWLEESAKVSTTPYDDLAMVIVPQLKKAVLDLIDKVDGEVG